MEDVELPVGVFVMIIVICAIVGYAISDIISEKTTVKELGSAICDQEYDMNYVYYSRGTLKCEPKEEIYDGLKVKIVED